MVRHILRDYNTLLPSLLRAVLLLALSCVWRGRIFLFTPPVSPSFLYHRVIPAMSPWWTACGDGRRVACAGIMRGVWFFLPLYSPGVTTFCSTFITTTIDIISCSSPYYSPSRAALCCPFIYTCLFSCPRGLLFFLRAIIVAHISLPSYNKNNNNNT